jgi:hypothetical protein
MNNLNTPQTTGGSSSAFGSPGVSVGGAPIVGVGLLSKKASIKIYKKQDHYNKWEFVFDPNQNAANAVASTGATTGTGLNGSTALALVPVPAGLTTDLRVVGLTTGPAVVGLAAGPDSDPVTDLVLGPVMGLGLDLVMGLGLADRRPVRPVRLVLLRRPLTHRSRINLTAKLSTS